MRTISSLFVTAAFALAQSHPSWWTLASPEATALVGLHADNLQHSVLAEPIAAELASTGGLGFPDLPCIKEANQILISSPTLLAIANGSFPTATLIQQTAAAHMKPAAYKNVALWISPGQTLSVAQLSDQLLAIGLRKTLEGVIDRFEEARDGAETQRHYSPLLAHAARYSSKDLWVVATQLPDPLASLFVPIESETKNFEGSVSFQDGLHLEATLDAGSENAAEIVAENLRGSVPTLPAIAREMQVRVDAQQVLLGLDVSPQQLVSSLRQSVPQSTPQRTPQNTPQSIPQATPPAPAEPLPVAQKAEPAEPPGPQIIRIFGLDEGTREIVLPPVKQQ